MEPIKDGITLKEMEKGMRRFKSVPKTKGGVPVKYVKGARNKKEQEEEIKRTAALYKKGKLTKEMMDKISKKRSKNRV
jgi:hypothetical protein